LAAVGAACNGDSTNGDSTNGDSTNGDSTTPLSLYLTRVLARA
jgi:hypothetical protein